MSADLGTVPSVFAPGRAGRLSFLIAMALYRYLLSDNLRISYPLLDVLCTLDLHRISSIPASYSCLLRRGKQIFSRENCFRETSKTANPRKFCASRYIRMPRRAIPFCNPRRGHPSLLPHFRLYVVPSFH